MSIPDIDADFLRVKTALARLEGRRQEMLRSYQKTLDAVTAAKSRMAARTVLDVVLKDVQKDVNDSSVGSYAKMLTALVQDVMDLPLEVGLDMTMERGLPSLDIYLKRNERKSDILENCGGSITNIICFGLRAIATKRSGLRQFLLLDEPDCWLEPDRVGNFFRVIEMASQSEMQILVVTHHRLSSIGTDANLIELTGHPESPEGLQASRKAGTRDWTSDDEPGLRSIRLTGHSSFADATIQLSPGLNIIMGENNIGKSRITRALRGVAYGESDDSDIRDDCASAEVEIVMEGNRKLSWSRRPKRNPVTLWKLTDSEGQVIDHHGVRCETGGRQVPDWMERTLGIVRYDGLDIQVAHQKVPVFLLDKPGSQRAMVLSVGGEAGMLRDMMALSRDDRTADGHLIRDGGIEIESILSSLSSLDIISDLQYHIDSAEKLQASIREDRATIGAGTDILNRLQAISESIQKDGTIAAATADLPDMADLSTETSELKRGLQICGDFRAVEDNLARSRSVRKAAMALPGETPTQVFTAPICGLVARFEQTERDILRLDGLLEALKDMPADHPELFRTGPMADIGRRLGAVQAELTRETAAKNTAKEGELAAAMKMSDLLVEIKNICPLCGTGGIRGNQVLSFGLHSHAN